MTIALLSANPVETLSLASLDLDASPHVRESIDDALVADYADAMRAGATFPPIVVFVEGTTHYLADGWHRVHAAQRNALDALPVVMHQGTRDDALWYALGANRTHGARLTGADKKHAALLALRAWPDRSQIQIAQQIDCSQGFVSQLISAYKLPRADRVIGSNGKTYPSRYATKQTPIVVVTPQPAPARTKAERAARIERVRTMANDDYTSREIAEAIGVSTEVMRSIVKQANITIPADAIVGRPRRLDPNRIVSVMAQQAESLCADVNLINFRKLDRTRVDEWIASFEHARRDLANFIRQLKEYRP